MKELLLPVMEIGNWVLSLAYWDDPLKSFDFFLFSTFIIFRGWMGYVLAFVSLFLASFIVLTRCFSNREKVTIELKVMSTTEQLLPVQNVTSQLQQLIEDANIVLLKFRALLLSLFPQRVRSLRCDCGRHDYHGIAVLEQLDPGGVSRDVDEIFAAA